ncbi:LacI family DNA-binding transcriptional regulator [Microbacterium sp. gxy059]|uniref:LacI family DNA-binding transcriptional regulator n=1 Tax=Microbacterium sp. gxy059 TaxID=2957199 RepID=UPI003D96AE03
MTAKSSSPRDAAGSGRRPTIGDVAARASVSKSAVSFVFNNRPGVSAASSERIRRAAEELGWQPSARARALSQSTSQTIGLVIRRAPELLSTDPFFPQFVAGVETELASRGYALLLQVVADDAAERAAYERFARESRVDGVFLTDMRVGDDRPAQLSELGLSAAVVAPPVEDPTAVGMDDGAGVRRAVLHLSSLGHRRIGHVAGPRAYVHSSLRQHAWEDALAELGLPSGPVAAADFTGEGGARATHELLDLPEPPTAIVYANDLMAIAGMAAASSRGLRVPEDLSVVGFDDVPLAPFVAPPLTTVKQNVVAWGAAAAETLVAMVEHRDLPAVALPDVEFIVRRSTARPRA